MYLFTLCNQIKAVDWPFEDTGEKRNQDQEQSIVDYLAEKHFDMVINLPMRNGGTRRASSFVTRGYQTRRLAIDKQIPLITDVKKAKLFVEVGLKIPRLVHCMNAYSLCPLANT